MRSAALLLLISFLPLLSGCAGGEGGDSDASFGDGQQFSDLDIQAPQCNRRVLEQEVINAREIGDHPLAMGRQTSCGKIMRGGHLGGLSADGCREFANLGIKTVVDLRMESERLQYPPPYCVTDRAHVVNATLPKLDPSAQNYVRLLDQADSLAAAFGALDNAGEFPAYIHCVIGRDRASTVTALVLLALGASEQTVVEEFDLNNDAGVSVDRSYIQAVIEEIKQRGGIEAYLASAGVAPAQLETLRAETITER